MTAAADGVSSTQSDPGSTGCSDTGSDTRTFTPEIRETDVGD